MKRLPKYPVAFAWPPIGSIDEQWYETTYDIIYPFQDDEHGKRRTHAEVLSLMRKAGIRELKIGKIIHLY
jgi:hypothetical protein